MKGRYRLGSSGYQRAYRIKNLEKIRTQSRDYYALHRDRMRKQARDRYARNPKKFRARKKLSREKNRELERQRAKLRFQRNPNFRIRIYLGNRLRDLLKRSGKRKSKSTLSLLGCSIEDFWIYLESKFEPGMTRENHGKVWHIDHIMPCVIFDLTKPEHQKRCFHFSNLQPLFAFENQSKHAKVLTNQFQLL